MNLSEEKTIIVEKKEKGKFSQGINIPDNLSQLVTTIAKKVNAMDFLCSILLLQIDTKFKEK